MDLSTLLERALDDGFVKVSEDVKSGFGPFVPNDERTDSDDWDTAYPHVSQLV
jgi:methyl coenzyme M reductase beta subunit